MAKRTPGITQKKKWRGVSARLPGTVSVKHEFLRLGLDLRRHGPTAVSEALRMRSQIGVACIVRESFVHLARHTGTNHIAHASIGVRHDDV